MRTWIVAFIFLIPGLVGGLVLSSAFQPAVTQTGTSTVTVSQLAVSTIQSQDIIEQCFSPGGSCASRIIYWIERANSSIHILTYSFTLNNIGDALIGVKRNKPTLEIKLVWDEGAIGDSGSEYQRLKDAGIEMRVDRGNGLMHDKVAVIDGHIVLTGSFNWTYAANEDNRENLIVINSRTWAAGYERTFQQIWASSKP